MSQSLRGVAQYLGSDYAPVGLWNFNQTFKDLSGNGNDLTVEAGTVLWTDLCPGLRAYCGDGSTNLVCASTTPALAITGDLTVSVLAARYSQTAVKTMVNFGSATADANHNYLYTVQCQTDSRLTATHMSGTRTTQTTTSKGAMSVVQPSLITQVRQNNVYLYYINGYLASVSTALTAPSGGSLSNLRVGSSDVTSERWIGAIASVKICNFALSDGQVLDEYNRTLGPMYGTR